MFGEVIFKLKWSVNTFKTEEQITTVHRHTKMKSKIQKKPRFSLTFSVICNPLAPL